MEFQRAQGLEQCGEGGKSGQVSSIPCWMDMALRHDGRSPVVSKGKKHESVSQHVSLSGLFPYVVCVGRWMVSGSGHHLFESLGGSGGLLLNFCKWQYHWEKGRILEHVPLYAYFS